MDDHCHKYHPEHIDLKGKVMKCTVENFEKIDFILDWKLPIVSYEMSSIQTQTLLSESETCIVRCSSVDNHHIIK
jgi:hypothetical protein